MASKDAPDIGLVPTNAAPYLQLIKADGLLPLDDVWQNANLSSRMDPAIAESLKWEGKRTPSAVEVFWSTSVQPRSGAVNAVLGGGGRVACEQRGLLVAAVAARKAWRCRPGSSATNIVQAAAALDVAVTDSLVGSGSFPVLHAAKSVGAASSLGCVCGRDRRRYPR